MFFITILLVGCKNNQERIYPIKGDISESIYASGIVKSKDQYEVHAKVAGIIEEIYVVEGDALKEGDRILRISNEIQKLNTDNAELSAAFVDYSANQGKLDEARSAIELSKSKMKNDSLLYFRQSVLWQQQIGAKAELEQRELVYKISQKEYYASIVRYADLKRQLSFSSSQAKKNLSIAGQLELDYLLRSEIDGVMYNISVSKGDLINPQTPLGVIGDANKFILEMQVDENDIFKIRKGLPVLMAMDSYKGRIFEAEVTKIGSIMNERTKTFLVEAEFKQPPPTLYPNVSFEANILIQLKERAMLIPRHFMVNDSTVVKSNGDSVVVKTGLKDYLMVEIISGITTADELVKPTE